MSLLATLQHSWIESVYCTIISEIFLPLLAVYGKTGFGAEYPLRLLLTELLTVRVEKITLAT